MIGDSSNKACKNKGAESWGLLLLFVDTARLVVRRLGPGGAELVDAGQCLIGLIQIFQKHGTVIPQDDIDKCFAKYCRFMDLAAGIDELLIPKAHIMCHPLERLHDHGNPKCFANWRDEGLNKLLKACCRTVSQRTFEPSLLTRMRALLGKRTVRPY